MATAAEMRAAEAAINGKTNAAEDAILANLQPFNVQTTRFAPVDLASGDGEPNDPAYATVVTTDMYGNPIYTVNGKKFTSYAEYAKYMTDMGKKPIGEWTGDSGKPSGDGAAVKQGEGPSDANRSAFALFKNTLEGWGLGDLVGWATTLYQSENAPVDFNEFYLLLKQQPTYIERFGKVNDDRIKKGLPALSESSIMNLESQYKKIMSAYNLPSGFYDQPEDFRSFIVNDLSAAEVADRVQAANAYVKTTDPSIRAQLNAYYGINDAALTAAALDPQKGQGILEQLAAKSTLGIAAGAAGLGMNYANQAAQYGAGELSFAKQAQGFGEAALMGQRGDVLSQIYAQQGAAGYSTEQAVTEAFGGATATQEAEKRKRLARMEENVFGGSSGVSAASFGTSATAGSL